MIKHDLFGLRFLHLCGQPFCKQHSVHKKSWQECQGINRSSKHLPEPCSKFSFSIFADARILLQFRLIAGNSSESPYNCRVRFSIFSTVTHKLFNLSSCFIRYSALLTKIFESLGFDFISWQCPKLKNLDFVPEVGFQTQFCFEFTFNPLQLSFGTFDDFHL